MARLLLHDDALDGGSGVGDEFHECVCRRCGHLDGVLRAGVRIVVNDVTIPVVVVAGGENDVISGVQVARNPQRSQFQFGARRRLD